MTEFVVYNTDGRILRYGGCAKGQMEAQAQAGEFVMEGNGGDLTHYVTGGVITERPAWPGSVDTLTVVANATDAVTFSSLPNPTDVTVSAPAADAFQVTDGTLELTFDTAGTYTVRLESFPYLDTEYTINAT